MLKCQLVVPCYNEALRLRGDAFSDFVGDHDAVTLLFVNDGSTDGTADLLRELVKSAPGRMELLDLERNGGKAAAVHRGMQRALASGADVAGYLDADLATPLEAVPQFLAQLASDPALQMVFGSRVKLLGREIVRSSLRHYLGRVFATAASVALDLAIYDTQCGAKVFRATPLVRRLFEEPFSTGWIFDVELLARLVALHRRGEAPDPASLIYEFPLHAWCEVGGSKVVPLDFPRAALELWGVYRRYLR